MINGIAQRSSKPNRPRQRTLQSLALLAFGSSGRMTPSDGKPCSIASRHEAWIRAIFQTWLKTWLVHAAGHKVVKLRARIRDAEGRDRHHDHLEHFKAGNARTERKDVLVAPKWIV